MTAAEQLASWSIGLHAGDVPPSARAAARRHLLDGLGNALAGIRLDVAGFALEVAPRLGPGPVPVPGLEAGLTSHAAAFALGTAMHAHDFDDTHSDALVHPTAVVGSTALAVGHEVGASGEETLTALVVGHEVMLRLGATVTHGFHARGFHATSVCGVFAAAVVAARLRGADVATTVAALGIAGSQASGSLEFLASPASTKQLHPGWAAMAGILATDLARAGATGPSTILEGTSGLYRAYADRDVEPSRIVDGLSERWEVERITIKPYPACQLSHASLDAIEGALGSAGLTAVAPEDVVAIEVDLPEDSMPIVGGPLVEKMRPRTPYEAKFSLPWCIAARLVDGGVGLDTFDPSSIARAEVGDLAGRVNVIATAFGGPPAAAPGSVRVRMSDGRVLVGHVASSRGTPASPLDDVALRAKFDANVGLVASRGAGGVVAEEDVDGLADAVGRLGEGCGPGEVLLAAQRVARAYRPTEQHVLG